MARPRGDSGTPRGGTLPHMLHKQNILEEWMGQRAFRATHTEPQSGPVMNEMWWEKDASSGMGKMGTSDEGA